MPMNPIDLRSSFGAGSAIAAVSTDRATKKVSSVCEQFENILVRQFISEAQKSTQASKPKGGSPMMRDIYNDMVSDVVAGAVSHSGQLGLRNTLEHQLLRQSKVETAPTPSGTT